MLSILARSGLFGLGSAAAAGPTAALPGLAPAVLLSTLRHFSAHINIHPHAAHVHPHSHAHPAPQPLGHPHSVVCILPEVPSQPMLPCVGLKYSERIWHQLASLFPDRHATHPTCITISPDLHRDGSGLCPAVPPPARQLEQAGFSVTSLVLKRPKHHPPAQAAAGGPRPCCLQVASEQAAEGEAAAEKRAAAAGGAAGAAARPWNGADLMCFADTMHMVDTRRALQAAHRHLRRHGLLAVLWTDLDQSDAFVLQLEELLELAMPGYCRFDCQRDPAVWVPRLQQGGLFRLIDYSCLPHSLPLPATAFMDSLDSRGALRSALGSSGRRSFHSRLQRLVEEHFGGEAASAGSHAATGPHAAAAGAPAEQQQQSGGGQAGGRQMVELPLHTKVYLLAKAPGAALAAVGDSASLQRAHGGLEPERYCLFCGNPVEVE